MEKKIFKINIDGIDKTGLISDGYHTFDELYEHRYTLFIKLCEKMTCLIYPQDGRSVWRSKLHHDGTMFDGWFILGINKKASEQITYHLPISKWDDCSFAEVLEKAPEFDGHTSNDVLDRLLKL